MNNSTANEVGKNKYGKFRFRFIQSVINQKGEMIKDFLKDEKGYIEIPLGKRLKQIQPSNDCLNIPIEGGKTHGDNRDNR